MGVVEGDGQSGHHACKRVGLAEEPPLSTPLTLGWARLRVGRAGPRGRASRLGAGTVSPAPRPHVAGRFNFVAIQGAQLRDIKLSRAVCYGPKVITVSL